MPKLYEEYRTKTIPQIHEQLYRAINQETERDDSVDKETGQPKSFWEAQGYRNCGAFVLRSAQSPIDIIDVGGTTVLERGQEYMGIHLLKLHADEANLAYARQSLSEVADYLKEGSAPGTVVAGITYARLGQTASRAFGFEMSELPIITDPTDDPAIRPVLVYATYEDIIERY